MRYIYAHLLTWAKDNFEERASGRVMQLIHETIID